MSDTPGTPISGNDGSATILGSPNNNFEIGKWTFASKTDLHSYASSKSGRRKITVAGNGMATGNMEGKQRSDDPSYAHVQDGDTLHVQLNFDNDHFIDAHVVVGEVSYDVDTDSGDLETFTCAFTTTGDYSYGP